jgi:hypothetical protein
LASRIIKKAVNTNNFSAKFFQQFDKELYKKYGKNQAQPLPANTQQEATAV